MFTQQMKNVYDLLWNCLLYTSDAADDSLRVDLVGRRIIKKFEKPKGWLSKELSSSSNQMEQLANILEERSIWQRYGF